MTKQVWFPDAELNDFSYTYAKDAYSCIAFMHYVHILGAWLTGIAGVVCFLTRIGPDRYKYIHPWSGRLYIVFMIITTASSILIHEVGMSFTTLFGLMLTLVVMCIGWLVVAAYKNDMDKAAAELVTTQIEGEGLKPGQSIGGLLASAKAKIVQRRTIRERVFNKKGLHGILMGLSWYQIAPRLFTVSLFDEYDCATHPAYKSPDGNWTLVPIRDPRYDRLPWAYNEVLWCVQIIAVPIVCGLGIGFFVAWRASKRVSPDDALEVGQKGEDI